MLDNETKRRIDTARDILVGKIPDPKSQVEQITIALVYKFMDDMDRESVEMGGKPSFFTGEYQKYGWSKIFSPQLGGFEMLALYADAITRMSQNPNIPQLFRDIFKNAFLPYRDPETLKLFLKTINEFHYDHSERLGDAFEYLLSVLGSQGEAGQFRTPRHIIDFMVEVINPQKNETILDPACGTAGFLVSSYKHILSMNTSISSPLGEVSRTAGRRGNPGDQLTPEERKRLVTNFKGYDISPDMVRLSLVNLYLHGFVQPQIYEYDTLTSEERWNEYADVILANPPFMSPKGGIKPHKRFSVQSNRSEVLFVDYMAEHLFPAGRAAIVVPEGIIFQSGKAYKSLRKMLVDDNYLVGVISLPAGVFNPYSGVKTCILWLDRTLAKKSDKILFVKISADGFDLGAQRRSSKVNDLTDALININAYKHAVLRGEVVNLEKITNFSDVEKSKIGENGEYNLSLERYNINHSGIKSSYPLVELGDVCTFEYGKPLKAENRVNGEFAVYGSNGIVGYHNEFLVEEPFVVIGRKGSAGEVHYSEKKGFPIDTTFYIKLLNEEKILLKYLYLILKELDLKNVNVQSGVPGLNRNDAYKIQIPLPPLSVQQELVSEVESYQKIIDGARQVVENYKPRIEVDPDWEIVELGKVCGFKRGPFGSSLKKEIFVESGYAVYEQGHAIYEQFDEIRYFIDENKFNEMKGFAVTPGDLIMSCSGTMGKVAIVPENVKPGIINQALLKLSPKLMIDKTFLKLWMESSNFQNSLNDFTYGAAIKNVASVEILKGLTIPLPDLSTQRAIVARIEREQSLVRANKELIEVFEGKIKEVVEKVWGS